VSEAGHVEQFFKGRVDGLKKRQPGVDVILGDKYSG